MAKFVYKFESIKKVKEVQEKKAQKEPTEIELEIENLKTEFDKLTEEENKSKKNFYKREVLVSELKIMNGYIVFLRKEKSSILDKIQKLKSKKEIKLTELIQKSKEHKIFNKLEETYNENFVHEQNHLELGLIDELATQKFIRQNK